MKNKLLKMMALPAIGLCIAGSASAAELRAWNQTMTSNAWTRSDVILINAGD